MTAQMTQRDKKLLYFTVVIAVVFVAVYFVIIPFGKRNSQLAEELEAMQATKTETEMKIAYLSELRKSYESIFERYDGLTKGFYPLMESQEIDRIMTSLALEHGLFAERLVISMPTGYSYIEPYKNSTLADERQDGEPLPGFYSAKLSFDLTGSHENIHNFLDFLGEQKAIHIVSAAWRYSDAENMDVGADAASTLKLELDFCMYEKYVREELRDFYAVGRES